MVEYSLYFHVPFCKKKCHYCHFYVIPDQERHQLLWMQSLEKEWHLRRALLPHLKPVSIYFGGGTPSLINPRFIEKILSWTKPTETTEITLEANPENCTREKILAFKKAGVNRISISAQTFQEDLLHKLGRTHSALDTAQAVNTVFDCGIHNISIDLMYDLPNQTLSAWEKSLDQALKLPVTHLSLYNLSIEPHTLFFKYKERVLQQMPSEETSLAMLQMAVEKCENAGLKRYEISAFAKPGFCSVHNSGYWTLRPFLGFGPSAFSFWQQQRFQNVANLNRYSKALTEKKDPCTFREKLPHLEHLKEKLAIGLRLTKGIALSPDFQPLNPLLSHLVELNLIKKTADSIRLTEKGLLFHDTVAEIIFSK